MAVLAAIPAFVDWLYIPSNSKAKKTGGFHLIVTSNPSVGTSLILTGAGFVLTIVAGFLGWTLVQTHHVGVDMKNSIQTTNVI